MHAVVGGDQRVLLDPLHVALPQQVPDVVAVFDLRQQPPHQLGGQHAGVELEDGPAQPQTVRHQTDLLHDVVRLAGVQPDVGHGVLEVTENLREGEGAHLVVEPLVVEQDVVVQIFGALLAIFVEHRNKFDEGRFHLENDHFGAK